MKTKIIALIMIIAMLFICVGCEVAQDKPDNDIVKMDNECRFEYLEIEEHPYFDECFQYWRDTTTDVVYVFYRYSSGNGRCGGFTPLINADGTPILWSEMESEKESNYD